MAPFSSSTFTDVNGTPWRWRNSFMRRQLVQPGCQKARISGAAFSEAMSVLPDNCDCLDNSGRIRGEARRDGLLPMHGRWDAAVGLPPRAASAMVAPTAYVQVGSEEADGWPRRRRNCVRS